MIIVSGASRGIGLGIATRLSSLGFEVVGMARSAVDLPFETHLVDVSQEKQVRSFSSLLKRSARYPTSLINAAGIASMNMAVMTPSSKAREILETNLLGTINTCQALTPLIARTGGGSIINFSSIAVALGLSGESVYAASKAGVETYTRVLAREVSGLGIQANCIAPGPIATDLLRGVSEKQIDAIISHQVIPHRFTVSDVCDIVEILLDPRSASISGQVLHVGGA